MPKLPGEEKEEVSETASVAGARSSYGAPSMAGQSRKGSMFDVGMDTSRTPIQEEDVGSQNVDECEWAPLLLSVVIRVIYVILSVITVKYFLFVRTSFSH